MADSGPTRVCSGFLVFVFDSRLLGIPRSFWSALLVGAYISGSQVADDSGAVGVTSVALGLAMVIQFSVISCHSRHSETGPWCLPEDRASTCRSSEIIRPIPSATLSTLKPINFHARPSPPDSARFYVSRLCRSYGARGRAATHKNVKKWLPYTQAALRQTR